MHDATTNACTPGQWTEMCEAGKAGESAAT